LNHNQPYHLEPQPTLSPRTTTNPVNSNHNQPLQLEPPLTLSPRAESRGSYYFIWYRFKTCSIARKLKNNVVLSPRTTNNAITSNHNQPYHLEPQPTLSPRTTTNPVTSSGVERQLSLHLVSIHLTAPDTNGEFMELYKMSRTI
jgi:hypothetical protein